MPSLVNNKDAGIRNLDPRRSMPEWSLLKFGTDMKTYEAELFDSVASEFTDIAGFPVEVYLYTPSRPDIFYGEAPISQLDGPYKTKMVFETPKESYAINILGFTSADTIQYAEVPKAIWLRDVEEQLNKKYDLDFDEERKPAIGDVIHCLFDDLRYEIVSITSTEKVFLGRKQVWSFTLKPYRVGNEGPDEKEMLFDSEPASTETDERNNDNLKVFTNKEQNKEKKKINELANTEKGKQIQELINPESKDTSYYGYFNGLRK